MNEYNDNIIDESKTILRIRLMPNELEDELEKNLKNVLFQKKKKNVFNLILIFSLSQSSDRANNPVHVPLIRGRKNVSIERQT